MDDNTYVLLCKELYDQAIRSWETPEMLLGLGGPLALAGSDAEAVRTEKNGYLGFIDRARDPHEVFVETQKKWKEHEAELRRLMKRGLSADAAARIYFPLQTRSRYHFGPQQLLVASTLIMGSVGNLPRWQYDVAVDREAFLSGLETVTDTIPALVAAASYGLNRLTSSFLPDDGMQEQRERQDMADALRTGQLFGPLARIAEAGNDTRMAREYQKAVSAHIAEVANDLRRAKDYQKAQSTPRLGDRVVETPQRSSNRGIGDELLAQRGTNEKSLHPSLRGISERSVTSGGQFATERGFANIDDLQLVSALRGRKRSTEDRAARFADTYPALSREPDSMKALENVFLRSTGFSQSGKVLKHMQSRASAAELMSLVRYLNDSNYKKIELIPAGNKLSFDFRAITQTNIGFEVEVTSATQATKGSEPPATRGSTGRAVPPVQPLREGTIVEAVVRKADRGQLKGNGVVVVVALFHTTDDVREWATQEIEALNRYMDDHRKNWPSIVAVELSALEELSRPDVPLERRVVRAVRNSAGRYEVQPIQPRLRPVRPASMRVLH